MPFIWNDEKFRWIGEHESYDEYEYSVVRKLYVELKPTEIVSYKTILTKRTIHDANCNNNRQSHRMSSQIGSNNMVHWNTLSCGTPASVIMHTLRFAMKKTPVSLRSQI